MKRYRIEDRIVKTGIDDELDERNRSNIFIT